ncbi:MAG: transglutaminase domain-containing protein [Bacteroidaceae bacterium]|nr:transglutaminase domain-containing protein [Bacteroidaceae bacterium]
MKNKSTLVAAAMMAVAWCNMHGTGIDKTTSLRDSLMIHYAADAQKQEAVKFIMDNIDYHASVKSSVQNVYYKRLAEIERRFKYPDCIRPIYELADSIRLSMEDDFRRVPDSDCVSVDYLVRNIDSAFEHWRKGTFARHLSFDEFCEYLLPYKLTNENVTEWRDGLYKTYKRGVESISPIDDKNHSAYWGATQINDILKQDKVHIYSLPYVGNVNLPMSVLENLRMGTCNDYAFKTAYVMRACGIPVCVDFTPQWPTRPHGHHWNVVLDNSGRNIPFMGAESNPGYPCKDDYIYGKVYRYTYSVQKDGLFWKNREVREKVPANLNIPFMKDVTSEYTKCIELTVGFKDNSSAGHHFAYLANFSNRNWIPVDFAEIKDGKAKFRNVGRGAVYLPVLWNGRAVQSGYPVLVSENGEVSQIKPDCNHTINLMLNRKYPVLSRVFSYSKRMRNAVFEASDDSSFAHSTTIAKIVRNPEMRLDSVMTNSRNKSRYIRYISPLRSHCNVAELQFYDGNKRLHPVSVGNDGWTAPNSAIENAFDDNFLTFYESERSNSCYLQVDFGHPVSVTKIKYMPRNDDNYVTPGHRYRLDYYDADGTKTIENIVATSDRLTFKNVPSNALYILHDLTAGKEERIFMIEDGRIRWY